MKLIFTFGGISFVGPVKSFTISPFHWRWRTRKFPKLGGGHHVSWRRGPFEIIKPNRP